MVIKGIQKQSKKKRPLKTLKKELWAVFSQVVKIIGGDKCYTCGRLCSGKNRHAGHFRKSSRCGVVMRYDLRNVKVQCADCNLWLDGNQYEFGKRLGESMVAEIDREIKATRDVSWDARDYELQIQFWKLRLAQLGA